MKKNNFIFKTTGFLLLIAFLNLEIGCRYFKVQKMEDITEDVSKSKRLELQQKKIYIILDCKVRLYSYWNQKQLEILQVKTLH